MASEENKKTFEEVKSMLLAGNVSKMKDNEDLYLTNNAKALKIYQSRYIEKLGKPGIFTFEHIWRLSKLLKIDIQLIIDIIKKEVQSNAKVSKRNFYNLLLTRGRLIKKLFYFLQ